MSQWRSFITQRHPSIAAFANRPAPIQMLIVTLSTVEAQPEELLGCLGCKRIAPVTDYVFVESGTAIDTGATGLSGYSRWTEPAFGLLARLVCRHPRLRPGAVAITLLTCTIHLGFRLEQARRIERLKARIQGGTLRVSLHDEFESRRTEAAVRARYAQPLDMLEHAARVAVWGSDEEPPIPPPLSEVPVHDDLELKYVLAEDIPAHPRRFFGARYIGCTTQRRNAFYAHDWLHFIGVR